jgi:hypothetical protein
MGVEEVEKIQTKGINNLFNKIIAKNFPSLEKEKNILRQEAYRVLNSQE